MRLVARLLAALSVGLVPIGALSAGDLLWEDRLALTTSGFPLSSVTAMATGRGMAFAVGFGPFDVSPSNNSNVLVRAYDPRAGLVWSDVWDASGYADIGRDIAVDGSVVVAVGTGATNSVPRDFLVRAYDARTGTVRWQDQFDTLNGDPCDVGALSIAAAANLAFVGGCALRAYDSRSGGVMWQHAVGTAAVATFDDKLFALGVGATDPVLRTYDAATGTAGWSVSLVGYRLQRAALTAGGATVFLTLEDSHLNRFLLAFAADDGTLLWQAALGDIDGGAEANAMALDAGRIFVSGPGGSSFFARAYGAATGDLLWEDSQTGWQGVAIEAGGGQLTVAGVRNGQFFSRTYSANSGEISWEDEATTPTGGAASAVASIGDWVFVGGTTRPLQAPFGNNNYVLRAYEAR